MLQQLQDVFKSDASIQNISIAIVSLTSITLLVYELIRWIGRIRGFSGPMGLPVVGNLLQIQGKDAPEQYRVWSKTYGSVYQISLGSIPVLVINSAAAAKELFIKNSHATASRPEFYTFHKIISNTSGTTLGTAPYTESLRRRRKAAASALNRPAVESYIPHLDRETKMFLAEAFSYGDAGKKGIDPAPLFLRMNLSIGLTLHWGARMQSQSDLFREIVHVEDVISNFRSTTGNLQDYVPPLRLNPFNSDSSMAADMRVRRDKYMHGLDKDLNEKMERGEHKPCIRANVKQDEEAKLNDLELTSLNLSMLAAGLDTMNSAVNWGIAMLATNQEVQRKAIEAIRETYTVDQPLCDENDQQTCKYLVAMIKEILRYYSVTRLSLPRRSIADIVYEGKVIPSGTVFFLNVWACNMDGVTWSEPRAFRPERWLEQPEAPIFTFGVGHRMCVGMQLAYRELYILFLRLLNSYEIVPDGFIEDDPIRGVANPRSLTTQPKSYKVKFVPRNVGALKTSLEKELSETVGVE